MSTTPAKWDHFEAKAYDIMHNCQLGRHVELVVHPVGTDPGGQLLLKCTLPLSDKGDVVCKLKFKACGQRICKCARPCPRGDLPCRGRVELVETENQDKKTITSMWVRVYPRRLYHDVAPRPGT